MISTFIIAAALDFQFLTKVIKVKYLEECLGSAYIIYAGIDENENEVLDPEEYEVSTIYCKDSNNEDA